jgi:hypothetical protein
MTSTEFFDKYNQENIIILLEGKRNVIELYKEKLITKSKNRLNRSSDGSL